MAVEYTLKSSVGLRAEDLRNFWAALLVDAVLMNAGPGAYVRTAGMDVSPHAEGRDPDNDYFIEAIGFDPVTRVTYRLHNLATAEERAEAERGMVSTTLAFLAACPGDGLLLLNGEDVILEQRTGAVTLNATWSAELFDEPHISPVVATYARRPLAQPFL